MCIRYGAAVTPYSSAISNLHYEHPGVGGYGGPMKSLVVKRSIVIDGHKTSVSLEDAFWRDLKNIAHFQQATLSELVARIDQTRKQSNLSSAIRLFVLEHFRHGDKPMEGAEADRAAASPERTQVIQT